MFVSQCSLSSESSTIDQVEVEHESAHRLWCSWENPQDSANVSFPNSTHQYRYGLPGYLGVTDHRIKAAFMLMQDGKTVSKKVPGAMKFRIGRQSWLRRFLLQGSTGPSIPTIVWNSLSLVIFCTTFRKFMKRMTIIVVVDFITMS